MAVKEKMYTKKAQSSSLLVFWNGNELFVGCAGAAAGATIVIT